MQRVGKHPYTLSLHDFFDDDGNFYLIMDLCTGGELFDQIAKKVRLKTPVKMCVWCCSYSIACKMSTCQQFVDDLAYSQS